MIFKQSIAFMLLLACFLTEIMAQGHFKNTVSSTNVLGGFKPFIDTLVYFGLAIGMLSVIRDFMLNKNENPFQSLLKWILAMAIYAIVSAFLF